MIKQQLEELSLKEIKLVKSIGDEIKKINPNFEIAYLPNLSPKEKVKYIFIAMEPSLRRWAKDEKEAKEMVEKGFRNFILSWDDFIFHFCITRYLSQSYYVTDISKAAMKVKDANRWRKDIYPKWIELLKEEIKIVGQNDCRLIFVGKRVEDFLKLKITNNNVLGKILHYSVNAAIYRKKLPQEYPEEYKKFKNNLSNSIILDFAKKYLKQYGIPRQMMVWILKKLKDDKTKLSESRKQLMFTYFKKFQEFS